MAWNVKTVIANKTMNGAAQILNYLDQQQVHSVFGYPGGAIMPLYDALLDFPIRHYLCRHEQGAAFAAIGYARSTGKTGVCFATSGPGATNLLTSLADAKLDSVPLVVITGQVARPSMGSDAFQEVDVLGLSLSICKHSMQVSEPEQVLPYLQKAFEIAASGRPGPVLLDVPKDILMGPVPEVTAVKNTELTAAEPLDFSAIEQANTLLQQAEKPLFYVGGGVAMADAVEHFHTFISQNPLPAVSTLKGLGTVPKDYGLNLGMLGMHGLAAANLAVQHCDLLLVIGARLDDRATGKLDEFAPHAKVIHLDIDPAEIHKRRYAEVAIQDPLPQVLAELKAGGNYQDWFSQVQQWQQQKAFAYPIQQQVDAPAFLNQLSEKLPTGAVISCDVGQHQMWVAQHVQFEHPMQHLSSGGLGTMGFGLPAAIGAQVARPEDTVIAVSGDGSFMMNVQELSTIKRYGLPVKIIILDNQRLGMVKQWQELFHEERYSETDLSDNPEFSHLARVFDIQSEVIDKAEQVTGALQRLLQHDGPYLLHVRLNHKDNVWPIVPPNTANDKMWEQRP